jgi:hypothetical protein
MRTEFIEPKPGFRLILVRAPGDPPLPSLEYQKELSDFARSLRAQGIDVSARTFASDAVGGGGGLSGQFILDAAGKIGPPLIAGIAGWLHGRAGRTVRLKVGDIDATAPTVREVKELLDRAEESRQRNQPNVIREA